MRYLFVIIIFLLSGCVHTINEHDIKTSYNMPETFRNKANIQSLNNNKVKKEYKDPVSEMKSLFPDKEFHTVLDYIMTDNPDLLILLSKVRQARYQLKGNTGTLFPQVSGSLEYSEGSNSDGLNGSLNLSWEVDIYGKLDALRRSSKELIKYAQENYVNGMVTMSSDAATYYFTVRKAAAQLYFSTQMLDNYKNILDIYTISRKEGLIDESKYIETTMDYLNAQNNVQMYKVELENNKNALIALMNNRNISFDSTKLYDTLFTADIPLLNEIPSLAVLNRPDVRSAVYTLNSELYKHYNKKMSLLPSLSINGNIGQMLASSTGIGDFIWQIAGSLMAPLINRQELYSALKMQEETVKQAELTLQKYINTAVQDIESAGYAMDSSNTSFSNTKKILENAKESFYLLEKRWEQGLIDDIQYLMAKNDMLTTYISYYTAWYDNISSAVMLYKAFGGSFSAVSSLE